MTDDSISIVSSVIFSERIVTNRNAYNLFESTWLSILLFWNLLIQMKIMLLRQSKQCTNWRLERWIHKVKNIVHRYRISIKLTWYVQKRWFCLRPTAKHETRGLPVPRQRWQANDPWLRQPVCEWARSGGESVQNLSAEAKRSGGLK